MDYLLEKSLVKMKELKTTQKKWNKFAIENDLLSTYTIMRLTGKGYRDLLKD